MKPRFIVGWDVDLTIFPTDVEWMAWMNKVCGTNRKIEDCFNDYQTGYHFPEFENLEIGAMDFWRSPTLYDGLQPVAGAYEAAERIMSAGGFIHWVSYCKSGHFSSKIRALNNSFPFAKIGKWSNFYATKEKGGVICDFAIDDRYKHLAQYNDKVVKIHYETPWKEDFKCPVDFNSSYYDEITDFILDLV